MKVSIFNSLKWTTISTIVNLIAKLGQISILTRFLTKSDFGVVSIALLFISFTEVFVDMGFSAAVLHKQNISKNEYSSLYWFNIITGVILFAILVLVSPLIANYYKEELLATILPLLSLNVIFSSISRLQRTIQQKRLKFHIIAYVDISSSIVMLLSAILLCLLGYGIYSLVFSTVLYYATNATAYLLYALFKEKNISLHMKLGEIVDYFRIGVYQTGSSLLNFFSAEMDVLIISTVYPMEIVGVYTICKQLASKAHAVINPIVTKVLTPTLALAQNDVVQLKNKFTKAISMISFINAPVYFVLIISAPIILLIVYGSQYVEYSNVFCVFCLNSIVNAIGNPQGSLLIAVGRTDMALYWNIFRIGFTSIALFVGARFDIIILAIIVLAVNVISIIPEVFFIYKPIIKTSVKDYLRSIYKPILLSTLITPFALVPRALNENYAGYFVAAFIFILFYWIISRKYDQSDYINLKSIMPTKLKRFLF